MELALYFCTYFFLCLKSYENLTQSGLYLKHLEIEETVAVYQDELDHLQQVRMEEIKVKLQEATQ